LVYHKVYSFLKAIACRGLADARALERGPIRCDLVEFDYAAIAKAMGSHAIRVSDPETVAETLREGLATDKHRLDRDARSGPDATGRRQPDAQGAKGRPAV
jgi:thiamine pyrophosphate-dependent acetolactate synthase large subunit-like protein